MERINIADILKDCPQGMKLYSLICGECTLVEIDENQKYPITVVFLKEGCDSQLFFTANGCYYNLPDTECLLFPSKDQRDWSRFQRPFKDGDIIADEHGNIAVYKGTMWYNKKLAGYYCGYRKSDNHFIPEPKRDSHFGLIEELHYATEKEKQKLFQVIKNNGYKWNADTKTIEELIQPIFKAGDKIRSKNKKDECFYILNVDKDRNKYILNIKGYCLEFKDQDNYELIPDKLVEPKFKVGDKVRNKNNHNVVFTITSIEEDSYVCGSKAAFWFDDQDKYELVPDKFDVNTLKPFDQVLVRDHNRGEWHITFYELYDNKNKYYPYITLGGAIYKQCIPYKGNEHLTGLIKDCDEYYKTWE